MQGSLVQASCGHRLEQTGQDAAGRYCDGCNASCEDRADSGAIQWFRCAEGCNFELCGSCHANGYPSAPFLSFFVDGRSNIPAPRFGPCSPARCTALHNAARQGDAGGVKALLAAGSDVHSTDPRGYSLRSRLLSRRLRGVECLLSDCRRCGECLGFADCRRGTGMCLLYRRTALHLASLNGHTVLAVVLVEASADVHCNCNNGYGSRGCILVL